MKLMINGRLHDLTLGSDGSVDSDQLRKVAQIPQGRPIIHRMPDGKGLMINAG